MGNTFMWANLVHLGSNLWNEEGHSKGREHRSTPCASPFLQFDRASWDRHMQDLKDVGVNTLIIDLAEAMRYESHPELAVAGSWNRDEMLKEIAKLRAMGFELVPKLNFSACHDVWLKDYSRMLSTPIYYQVVADLIHEVCEVFKPKYFHIGMDEETYENQRGSLCAVVRQYDLWWKDFYFMVDCVEKEGARSWIWSDYAWHHPDLFAKKMPKSVLQSNWYYWNELSDADGISETKKSYLAAFDLLEKYGYDQVPTGSVWAREDNFEVLTKYVTERVSPEHLLGMMQTTGERIDPDWMHVHDKAVKSIKNAKEWYESR